MIITKESTGDLTATIKIEIEPVDYQDKVDTQLKDCQRKANIPGFRPGKVPFGMVKKMYGKAMLYEEVNKAYSEGLHKYMMESQSEILASPLPNHEKNEAIDLDTQTTFSFYFDIALAPEFTVDISDRIEVPLYKIAVTEDIIDKYLNDIRKRYGKLENVETIEDHDMVTGTFEELDEKGNVKENGIKKDDAYLYMEFIQDETSKKKLIGLKVEDSIELDPKKIARSEHEEAYFLGLKKEQLAEVSSKFKFTVKQINRSTIAEMDEEFFKKVYPDNSITTVEQMRELIRKQAADGYQHECEHKFKSDVAELIRTKTDIDFPEEFMKRYLLETTEDKKITKEQIDAEWDETKKAFQWQLIENKIVKDNKLAVTQNEVKEFIKSYFIKAQVHEHEHDHEHEHEHHHEEDDARFDKIAETIMENEEETKKITEKLFDDKLFDFFKTKLNVKEKEVTYDDFVKLISIQKQ